MVLLFLAAAFFSSLSPSSTTFVNPAIGLVVYFLTIFTHEIIHGVFFKLFGGKPIYGVGVMYYFMPYAYATSPKQPYSLGQMVAIGLSPLIILSAAAIAMAGFAPQLASYAAIVFIGNASGAVGDLWLIGQALRFRGVKDLTFVDLKDGIAVHGQGAEAAKIAAHIDAARNPSSPQNRFLAHWLTSSGIVLLLSVLLVIILLLIRFEGHVVVGPEQLPLFEFTTKGLEGSFTLNPIAMVIAGLISAVVYSLVSRKKSRV